MNSTFANAKQRTNVPFRHDIVGSFLRPAVLKEARAQFQTGKITADELRKVEDEEIIKLVQKQKEVGLKGVTDGEFRRSWFNYDFMWGFDGVEKKILNQGVQFHGAQTRAETASLTGKLCYSHHPMIDHFKFLKSVAGDDVIARQNIISPAYFLRILQLPDNREKTAEIYPNYNELLEDIVAAFRQFILALYEAGCRNLQLDDVTWGILCDVDCRERLTKVDMNPDSYAQTSVDLNNRAIEGLPEDLIVTMHTCRGNYRSTWLASGGYDPVAKILFGGTKITGFYLEFDTDRSGTFESLRFLPKDKQVVIGLFSSKFGALEDKEQILARIQEASKIVDINQICISTQCGFASTEEGNVLTEEEQWNKLRFIKSIADEIWH